MDPFEGRLNSSAVQRAIARLSSPAAPKPPPGVSLTPPEHLFDDLVDHLGVNCWHENAVESAAMWKIYCANEGIAIRSTVGRIKEAIRSESRMVYIERVNYRDEPPTDDTVLLEWWIKRKSFAHEHEIRLAVILETGPGSEQSVDVDLQALIAGIRISPVAPIWYVETVTDMVARYGLSVEDIQASPLYSPTLK